MADEDDLEAFFDEVREVEKKAVVEEDTETPKTENDEKVPTEDSSSSAPPPKRQKTGGAVRPRGVVVAAATSALLPADKREEKEKAAEQETQQQQKQPEPQQQPASNGYSNHHHHHPYGVGPAGPPPAGPQAVGPTLPPGPMVGPAAIGPAFPGSPPPPPPPPTAAKDSDNVKPNKSVVRMAAGKVWKDETLAEWPENDYRIFVGNLSNDVDDAMLFQHFSKYPSLAKAKVVRHNNNPEKTKGYGFVSLLDPLECAKAIREMDQTWLSSRPIRVKRSDWKERDLKQVKKKEKKEKKMHKRMGIL